MAEVASSSNLAGMRHVASSDVLLNMQNIELHPIAKPEKPSGPNPWNGSLP